MCYGLRPLMIALQYIKVRCCPKGKPCFLCTLLLKISLLTDSITFIPTHSVPSTLGLACCLLQYSGTLPYDNAINTATSCTATLFWPKQKFGQLFSYLKNPFNTSTPLIRPDFCGPLVTGLMGFHCINQLVNIFCTCIYLFHLLILRSRNTWWTSAQQAAVRFENS